MSDPTISQRARARSVSMILAVLARPESYTLCGTFAEVYAYLDGYCSGQARMIGSIEAIAVWSELGETIRTLYSQHSLAEAFERFRSEHDNDAAAFKAMMKAVQSMFPEEVAIAKQSDPRQDQVQE